MHELISLKIRRYLVILTELNENLGVFPGSKDSNKMGEEDLNNILIHSIHNRWIKQAYLQGFELEIPFNNSTNMFEWIEIVETIYKRLVAPYKNPTYRADTNRAGLIRKWRG